MNELTLTGGTEDITLLNLSDEFVEFNTQHQLFDKTFIPKKVKTVLERFIPIKELKKINNNKTVAIEKCLTILTLLTSTIFDDDNPEGWKNLSSTIMHDITKNGDNNTFVYTKIIKLLKKGSKENGPIIEVDDSYHIDAYTKKYRLTDKYRTKGFDTYKFKTESIIKQRRNTYNKKLALATTNPIARNSLFVQSIVTLPTKEELLERGRELVKSGYRTKKGKLLTMRNKHKNEYWSDVSERSFVEDDIKRFELLTGLGYLVPIVGGDKSGGRVVDSFTLMPSWIRNMCLIYDQPIVEKDYSALHPNICAKLYDGPEGMITHEDVAEYLNISRREAKIEHLSFFNKIAQQMKKSALYKYYDDNHPTMLKNIVDEKFTTEHRHKITSMRLFRAETDLMTEVLEQLNSQGIYCIYVYDALYVNEDLSDIVGETMNRIANDRGINTTTDEVLDIDEEVNEVNEEECVDNNKEETPLIDKVPNLDGWNDDVFGEFNRMCVIDDIQEGKIKTLDEVEEIINNTITKYI